MRARVPIAAAVWLVVCFRLIPCPGWSLALASASQDSAARPTEPTTRLRMSPGIVCKSIDGYENYERLPGAAQTSDEKLLVYVRPLGFETELVDGEYQAHLVPDIQIRKRGEKAILRQKKKAFEYKPRSRERPRLIYLKNVISLKDLPPGEYDLNIILHDEVAKGPPATQVVRFRIIPAADPRKEVGKNSPRDRPT
jgi:hypothetical protein